MGNVFHVWWTVLWTSFLVTFLWWIFQPVVYNVMLAVQPYVVTPEAIMSFTFVSYVWHYMPAIWIFVLVVWALWNMQRRDPEVMESGVYYQ